MTRGISRAFWSLYGRLAWDLNTPPARRKLIEEVLGVLLGQEQSSTRYHVLDVGCGTGDFAVACAQAGMQVTGIDSATGMLARARSKLSPFPHAAVHELDIEDPLPFADATFGAVLLVSVLHLTRDPAAVLSELRRILEPGGTLVVFHASTPRDRKALAVAREKAAAGPRRRVPFALLWLKTWAEQRGRAVNWSRDELVSLLQVQGFTLSRVTAQAPFLAIAKKDLD